MAFLDNSGDIILDAVLTDVGRKRMANGNFRITKFTIGDDEIDYGLYNKDHPSGSAYYDLEILQTPVFEAFTQMNANINYGLVSYPRQDLLYLPSAEVNQKTFDSQIVQFSATDSAGGGVIFLADNTKTTSQGLNTAQKMIEMGANQRNILDEGSISTNKLVIETGLKTQDLAATIANQATYITSVGLMDSQFSVKYDSRFISTALGPSGQVTFANNVNGGATFSVTLTGAKNTRKARNLADYDSAIIDASPNRVIKMSSGDQDDISGQFSAFAGPRGAVVAFNLSLRTDITQADYSRFGSVTQNLFGASQLYDYIDTTVYVQGLASNASLQIPIRIIKLSQS